MKSLFVLLSISVLVSSFDIDKAQLCDMCKTKWRNNLPDKYMAASGLLTYMCYTLDQPSQGVCMNLVGNPALKDAYEATRLQIIQLGETMCKQFC